MDTMRPVKLRFVDPYLRSKFLDLCQSMGIEVTTSVDTVGLAQADTQPLVDEDRRKLMKAWGEQWKV